MPHRRPRILCGAVPRHQDDVGHSRGHHAGMSLPPDQPSPPKPKLSAEQQRLRQEDRLKGIRLRMAIGRELDDREITDPAAIGAALGMPKAAATKLLTRNQWREGDVALLEAAAARLGVQVPKAQVASEGANRQRTMFVRSWNVSRNRWQL